MLEPGQRLADRYRIIEPLGEGGMGAVFVARDEMLGRLVALKTVTTGRAGDETARRRMLREARTAARFEDPGIAQVHDAGETDDGDVFVVMELVRGRTVRALAEEGLSRDETLRILDELAATLDAAHAAGFIHRDVKPDNAMVRDDGRVTLLDFGLAKPTEPESADLDPTEAETASMLTAAGFIVGTPVYMAPEQAWGDPGPATDQWALAVMAWELLVGRPPWSGATPAKLLQRILREPPPRASEQGELPEPVDGVFDRAFAKEPSERFGTTGELARALRGALSGEEASADGVQRAERGENAASGSRPGRGAAAGVADPLAVAGPTAAETDETAADRRRRPSARGEPDQPTEIARGRGSFLRVAALAVGGLAFAVWAAWSATGARDGGSHRHTGAPTASTHAVWTATRPPPRETRLTRSGSGSVVRRGVIRGASGDKLVWEDGEGLWRRPRAGGERARITLPAEVPAESRHLWDVFADGERLLLGAHYVPASLVVVDLRSQGVTILRKAAFGGVLSHDERAVAYTDVQGLGVVGIDGSGSARLAAAGEGDAIHSFVWSPDDRFVAYRTKRFSTASASETVETVTRDGERKHRIAEGPRLSLVHLGTVVWPEQDRILYVQAGPSGTRDSELWSRRVHEGTPTAEAPSRVYIWPDLVVAHLSMRGERLSFVREPNRYDVWLLPLGSGPSSQRKPRRLTSHEHYDRSPDWTPDGEVLFMSNRRGSWDLFGKRPGESDARFISGGPRWQTWPRSDGAGGLLFFELSVDEDCRVSGAALKRVETSGDRLESLGPLRVEATTSLHGRPPPWTHQVRCTRGSKARCIFGTFAEGRLRFEDLAAETGARGVQHADIAPPGGAVLDWALSPAGDRIAVVGPTPEVVLVSLEDGSWSSVAIRARATSPNGVGWSPDGQALYLTAVPLDSAPGGIARLSLTGEVDLLYATESMWVGYPVASPDGRWLAFTGMKREPDVWMLEGL